MLDALKSLPWWMYCIFFGVLFLYLWYSKRISVLKFVPGILKKYAWNKRSNLGGGATQWSYINTENNTRWSMFVTAYPGNGESFIFGHANGFNFQVGNNINIPLSIRWGKIRFSITDRSRG